LNEYQGTVVWERPDLPEKGVRRGETLFSSETDPWNGSHIQQTAETACISLKSKIGRTISGRPPPIK